MFRQRTTIIVGAGASCELGLPSGEGLKNQILQALRPTRENAFGFSDPVLIELMKARVREWGGVGIPQKLQPVQEAAERIRKGLPLALSIDNFLHSHQGSEEIERLGKLTIALSILRAEAGSHLFIKPSATTRLADPNARPTISIHGPKLNQTWYPSLAQILMSGIHRKDVKAVFDNVRFVIFNYDRCLEQYLWMALQDYFDIGGAEAAEILSSVEFVHPYGHLGALPWQLSIESVEFGGTVLPDLNRVASGIRTFTESVRSEVGGRVKAAVEWAQTLVILGFGYLDQNIQLLARSVEVGGERVFSTAYGVSLPDQTVIREAMSILGGVPPEAAMIEPGSCRDLFDNYRLHLSLR